MPAKYFTLSYSPAVKHACILSFLSIRKFGTDLSDGKSLNKIWPNDMSFSMQPDKPKDTILVDYILNLHGAFLASPKLCDFIRTQNLPDMEFLKVNILDPKGKVAADDYSIIQCCRIVDCVDQEKSTFEWDNDDKTSMTLKTLVIKDAALGANDRLIRPKFVRGKMLFREDLAQALSKQGFPTIAYSRALFGDYKVYRQV